MFDLASDTAMKQVLEGSVYQVSTQLIVDFLSDFDLFFELFFYYLCIAGYDPPRQEVRRTPVEGKVVELLSMVAERT